MTQRFSLHNVDPDLYKHLGALEGNIARNIEHSLHHLIKLRASMINGCAFCIDMHSTDALKAGETTARLFGLGAWWETPLYTDREIAALRLTDAVTRLGEHGVPDEVYDAARAELGDDISYIVAAIGMINLWNRLAITFQMTPASALASA